MPAELEYVAQPSTYELKLIGSEDPEPHTTGAIVVEEGAELFIHCEIDDEFEPNSLELVRDDKPIDGLKHEEKRKRWHIEKFNHSVHSGLFICEAKTKSEDPTSHWRQMRISGKGIVPDEPCPSEFDEKCGSQGKCAIHLGKPTCFCNRGHHGEFCEYQLVMGTVWGTEKKMLYGAGAASGVCFTATLFFAVLFALLYIRERKHRRQLVSFYGPLPKFNVYGDANTPQYTKDWKPPLPMNDCDRPTPQRWSIPQIPPLISINDEHKQSENIRLPEDTKPLVPSVS